jgi:hypothetical protein
MFFLLWLLCSAWFWGCFNDSSFENNSVPVDAACIEADGASTPHGRLVVATEQYGSGGGITVIDLDTRQTQINVALTHDDVTVRYYDGRIWVLNRQGADNIMILDGTDYHLLRQFSLQAAPGEPCNAQDITFLDTCRMYVSCYEQPFLLVVDPTAPIGRQVVSTIDLSTLADDDGLPELFQMYRLDDMLYVSVQRMDRANGWVPVAPSYLAAVDLDTEILDHTIPLATLNPVGPLVRRSTTRELVTATAGDWSGQHAGLELIDTETQTATALFDTAQLGAIPSFFTLNAAGCGHVLVTRAATWETGIVSFCLDPPTVDPCIPLGDFTMTDLVLSDRGHLYVADRSIDPFGVRIYAADTCLPVVQNPIATGFAPGFADPLLLIPATDALTPAP